MRCRVVELSEFYGSGAASIYKDWYARCQVVAGLKNPVDRCLEAQRLRVQHALVHLPCVCKRKTLKSHRERRHGRLRRAYRRQSIYAHRPITVGR